MATVSSLSTVTPTIGSNLTINGSGFGASQGASYVMLGPVTLPVVSWSDTAIVVTIPSDGNTGDIYVHIVAEADGGLITLSGTAPAQC